MSPTELAEKTCEILETQFPELNVYPSTPEHFFEDFFCEGGYPVDPEYFEVWFEEGAIIGLEAKDLYWWEADKCEMIPSEGDPDAVALLVVMIHADGNIYEADQDDGHLNLLFNTPSAAELAEYLKLFFPAGREALRNRSSQTAVLKNLYIPFFQFPDDYDSDYNRMPVVEVLRIKDLIEEHLAEGRGWLSAMVDLHEEIKNAAERAEQQRVIPPDLPSFLQESKEGTMTGWEFAHALFLGHQKRNESERPKILDRAQGLKNDQLLYNWEHLNHLRWDFPSYSLGGTQNMEDSFFPLLLAFNESVFVPALEPRFNPRIYKQLFDAVKLAYWEDPAFEFPIHLDLPSYFDQVQNCFLQKIMTESAPILAQKAMQLKLLEPRSSPEEQLQRRREVWQGLRGLLGG